MTSYILFAIQVFSFGSLAGDGVGSPQTFGAALRFQALSLDQGLSQSVVQCIARDGKGFMWFGTQDGLNRYDGYEFVHLRGRGDDENGLADNYISALYTDRKGNLWIGTSRNGFHCLDINTGKLIRFRFDSRLPKDGSTQIQAIHQDGDGFFWLGTERYGLLRFDPKSERFSLFSSQESKDRVHAIVEGPDRTVWIGTAKGLYILDREKNMLVPPPQTSLAAADSLNVKALLVTTEGGLWIGTNSRGLYHYRPDNDRLEHYSADANQGGLSHGEVSALLIDRNAVLWVGTAGGGLNRFNSATRTFEIHKKRAFDPKGLSSSRIRSVYEDPAGVMWVGTAGGGVNKLLSGFGFELFIHNPFNENSIAGDSVRALYVDDAGVVWIGNAASGLSRFDRKKGRITRYRHHIDRSDSLSDARVRAITRDEKGVLWIGTEGGLNRMDEARGTFERFLHREGDPNTIPNNYISSLLAKGPGGLWIGSLGGGLSLLDTENQKFTHYRHLSGDRTSIPGDRVRTLFKDNQGRLWVGTEGDGAARLADDTVRFERFQNVPGDSYSLSNNKVWCFYQDQNDGMWIATSGGLNRMYADGSGSVRFRRYTELDGLPNSVVYAVLGDEDGNLWLSTSGGLAKLSPTTGGILTYTTSHGLQSNEFNQGGFAKAPDGMIYFGGIQGVNAFYPQNVRPNRYKPPVVFTKFDLYNAPDDFSGDQFKGITYRENIHLPYRASFRISFAALDYTNPSGNRFRTMLEGVDKQWVPVFGDNRRDFSNLEAGNYVFHVVGYNNEDVAGDQEARLVIRVDGPVWKSPWAYVAYVLIVIGLIGYYIRHQAGKLERKQSDAEHLERLVSSRTKKLIETQQQLVDAAHLAGMAEIATEVLHNVGNALNSANVSVFVIQKRVGQSLDASLRLMRRFRKKAAENTDSELLVEGLSKLSDLMEKSRQNILDDTHKLQEQLQHIRDILTAQQAYAAMGGMFETLAVDSLAHEALDIEDTFLKKYHIEVEADFQTVPETRVLKSKLVQVLCHLIKNACEAIEEQDGVRVLRLSVAAVNDAVIQIVVADSGSGIAVENRPHIFSHGFTTKPNGHGFGLHFCANAMTEMNGRITAESEGRGKGSAFILELPITTAHPKDNEEPHG